MCKTGFYNGRARIKAFINATDPEKERNIIFAHQRKLIYRIVENEYSDKVTATNQMRNKRKVLVIERKWSAERQLADVEKRNEDDENEYRRLVGLSAILLKISKSVRVQFSCYLELLLFPVTHRKIFFHV